MYKTIIIAEIGECYNGSMRRAYSLIDVAKMAGCDYAKFQTLDYDNISHNDPEKDWFKKIALTPDKIERLINYAQKSNIDILFTPENIKTAEWLVRKGQTSIKIASSLMVDMKLLDFVNTHFGRVFLSTGMATLEEVKQAVSRLKSVSEMYILHCVSEYPTGLLLKRRGLKALSPYDARLNMMKILMNTFPRYKIGYSDHTLGIFVPMIAVAMGAQVIEKHITLDRKTPIENFRKKKKYLGTDHILSLEPDELKRMVKNIRKIEKIMGEYEWKRSEGENLLRDFLRDRFVKT